MNQIQQIQRINQQELDSGATASWHDQYKDSAYINVGGLPFNLTEGDVLAIFSQYGEILDINLPRDKVTGKVRGFAWLMYSDQRSTILAVDNLNGATILGRMIRVDHTLNYKQLEHDQETGKMKERETESFAADPRNFIKKDEEGGGGESDADSQDSLPPNFDPEDPMAEYILSQHRESKKRRIEGGRGSSKDKEERKRRKEERRLKREERERRKGGSGSVRRGEIEPDSRRRQDEGHRFEERDRRRERERSRSPAYDSRRSRDDHDRDRLRDERKRYDDRGDRDRDRDERRNSRRGGDDERRDSRRPGESSSRGSAFADLEKWARR